ncbi:MAG: hypothetical protein IJX85_06315 [Lachnospiraceae bacterium]|nr:hypothetical protein [Lachnospiraceae bacterium]
MSEKERRTKGILTVIVIGVLFYGYSLLCLIKPSQDMSLSERRPLKQRPELKVEALASGEYSDDFEEYALDQAAFRDELRTAKSVYQSVIMRKLDHQGYYLTNGYISRLDYPLDTESIDNATERFRYIYDTYLADKDVSIYMSIIPDKNYFNEKLLYPAYDYNELVVRTREGMEYAQYISIMNTLSMEDYYKTDTHLRQERLAGVADFMGREMNVSVDTIYDEIKVTDDFKGVYYSQFGFPMRGEEMYYLTNSNLEDMIIYDHENNRQISMYDMEALEGNDPYEFYLHGPLSLITIENPNVSTVKELVIFRDSFGSNIAPLLATGYRKVTLVDIRYLPSNRLGQFIEFENQDVLFLYSTGVLNNSETLK